MQADGRPPARRSLARPPARLRTQTLAFLLALACTVQEIVYDISARDRETGPAIHEASLEQLDELDDDDDEDHKAIQAMRERRLAELRASAESARFGELREISQEEYIPEVSRCKDWIVLHLYADGYPQCQLVNLHLTRLARKFPATKFLRIVADSCIPGYPHANLPTIFVYHDMEIVKQIVTLRTLYGSETTADDLEWALARTGAIKTDMEENPRADTHSMSRVGFIGVRPGDPDEWAN